MSDLRKTNRNQRGKLYERVFFFLYNHATDRRTYLIPFLACTLALCLQFAISGAYYQLLNYVNDTIKMRNDVKGYALFLLFIYLLLKYRILMVMIHC